MVNSRGRAVAEALVWLACFVATIATQSQAESFDFKGKTISIVVGFGSGGGYDADARLLARYMGSYLPGNPTIVVRDMPGAGGLVAMNHVYNNSPHDGTELGVVAPSVAVAQILRSEKNIKYDVRNAAWIGRITPNDGTLIAWTGGKYQTIKDAQKFEVAIAGTGPTSDSVVFPRLLNEFIGTKFRIVSGYSGTNDAQLSLERGEVDAFSKNWANVKVENASWLADKKILITLQYAARRDPQLVNVPAAIEFAQNDDQRKILALFASASTIGVSVVAPPNLSPDLVNVLRDAFKKTIRDQRLIKEAQDLKLDIDPLSGRELQEVCATDFAIPESLLQRTRDILQFE